MRTWIELIKPALRSNCNLVKKFANKYVAYVLKSNAYGHGSSLIASYLAHEKCCDVICVAYTHELKDIRDGGWNGSLLVLSYIDKEALNEIVLYNAACAIYSIDSARCVIDYAFQNSIYISVHLKIETGMHRLGLQKNEIDEACTLLAQCPFIKVIGIYTHCFAAAHYKVDFILKQSELFNSICAFVKKKFPLIITHAYSTGALSVPNTYDMTRCGSALYGIWKSNDQKKRLLEEFPDAVFKQVLRWKSCVMSIKDVLPGEYIGYNLFFQAEKLMRVAVIPVGYADGYNRLLSGKSGVIIKGKWAPLCGYISMNMMTVDITHILDICVGDEVCLSLPEEENKNISLQKLGSLIDTPGIAFSTGISPLIPRRFVNA